jgi:hypothetical protein
MTKFKKYLPTIIGIVVGAIAGYYYYDYKSCASGTCIITSKPTITILYGALLGGLLFNSFQTNRSK